MKNIKYSEVCDHIINISPNCNIYGKRETTLIQIHYILCVVVHNVAGPPTQPGHIQDVNGCTTIFQI